jgi:hypothetical protein
MNRQFEMAKAERAEFLPLECRPCSRPWRRIQQKLQFVIDMRQRSVVPIRVSPTIVFPKIELVFAMFRLMMGWRCPAVLSRAEESNIHPVKLVSFRIWQWPPMKEQFRHSHSDVLAGGHDIQEAVFKMTRVNRQYFGVTPIDVPPSNAGW